MELQLYKCSKCSGRTRKWVWEKREKEKKSSITNFIVRKSYKIFNLNIGFNFVALLWKWHFAICLGWHIYCREWEKEIITLLSLNSFLSRTFTFSRRWKTFRLSIGAIALILNAFSIHRSFFYFFSIIMNL